MRFLLFFLLISVTCTSLNAQTISIRVLGSATYNEYAESNGVIVSFSKSDFEDKKQLLLDSIKEIGINTTLTPIERVSKFTKTKKRYRIEESNLELFDKLLILCSSQKVRIEKVYYKLPKHKFENEDENAILAFNNASTQAKIIANNLNYKITKILNIDDDTTQSSAIYDIIDKDSEHGRALIRVLTLLGGGNLYKTESEKPFRSGGYNLWVTFEMKKK